MNKIIAYHGMRFLELYNVEGDFTSIYAKNCKLIASHAMSDKDYLDINSPDYNGPNVKLVNGTRQNVKMVLRPDEIWILCAGQNKNVTNEENFNWGKYY